MPEEIVSHYRLIAKLGDGGMGIVYRAQDLKLGRDVALKFLPEHVPSGSQALERFEREARAASALNHPNICTIYEVDQHAGRPFIAMELLDGATLREKIGGRPVPVLQLLDEALQICEGLEAAHAKGIVHRDIKPANLFVTANGRAKILDFGLAKVVGSRAAVQPASATAAITEEVLTSPGTAVGTIAYMSPEQARGEDVDARTDLFSFGVVLYEMATGISAFRGSTSAVIFDAILNREPAPAASLNPAIPAELGRIIGKTMEKDRRLRYQTAADLSADLQRLRRDMSGHSVAAAPVAVPRRGNGLAIGAAVVLLAATGVAWILQDRLARPVDVKPVRLTSNSGELGVLNVALSPDGKYLAYSDRMGIHLRVIASGETHLIPQSAGYFATSWFPDGTRLAAIASVGGNPHGVYTLSMMGGEPHKLSEDGDGYAIVSPDGAQIAFEKARDTEIWIMSANGENPHLFRAVARGNQVMAMTWSPDSSRIAWTQHWAGPPAKATIESAAIAGGEQTTAGGCPGRPGAVTEAIWAKDGRLLFVCPDVRPHDQNFWAVRVDSRTGKPSGEPQHLTNWSGFARMSDYSITADGKRLAFLRNATQTDVSVAELDAGDARIGPLRRVTLDDSNDRPLAWMPDSKTVIFGSDRNGGGFTLYKQALDGESAEPMLPGNETTNSGRITPDQEYLLYQRMVGGRGFPSKRYVMRLQLSGGVPEEVYESGNLNNLHCSRAPATACICSETTGAERIISEFDPMKGKGRELFRIPASGADADISPDGKHFAYLQPGGKIDRVRFLDAAAKLEHEVTLAGWPGINALDWAADGKGLFLGHWTATKGASLLYLEGATGKLTPLLTDAGQMQTWAIPSPDGKRIAVMTGTTDRNVWMMEGF